MKTNALILIWNGSELPDYLVSKIAEVLFTNNICVPELLTIKSIDEEGIAKALVNSAKPSVIVRDAEEIEQPLKNAVIYIGERFNLSIQNNVNMAFTTNLIAAVIEEKGMPQRPLSNALEIISTSTGTIPQSLARKYHFTRSVVDMIKAVYNGTKYPA